MLKKTIIIMVIAVCGVNANLHAETAKVVGEPFPPMTNEDGTGQQFEIAKAVFESSGINVECKTYPYKRARRNVEVGDADMMLGMLKTDSDRLIFSELPHDADNILAIYPKNKNIKWNGINTLRGKRLAWARGLGFDSFFDFDYQWSEIGTRKQAFKKMLKGRDDFMIDAECGFLLKEVDSMRNSFETKKIGFLRIHCCFSNTEKGKRLKKIWDREYIKLMDSGKAEAVYKKWDIMREYEIIRKCLEQDRKKGTDSEKTF